tara:strand:+ start:1479 stop:2186 length:708 start_codon:yes stop_codon:yes gene_type:complete
MEILKKIIKKLLPPIFFPTIFKECINYFIKGENKIIYEDNFYNRIAFINKAISKFKDCNYLEIGVADNTTFSSIPLPLRNKIGVDPSNGGTHRMTSDEFFNKNQKKFNVIFIDGLHIYEQCQKDCINSLKFIEEGGIILFHDFLPQNYLQEKVPRKSASWTGDVWKVAVELSNSEDMDFRIANIDYGVGILKPGKNAKYKKMPELNKMNFDDLLNKFYKKLPTVNSEEAIEFIKQ